MAVVFNGDEPAIGSMMESTSVVPRLLSIQVGLPRRLDIAGPSGSAAEPWTSAIFKTVVNGPVFLGETNLVGDGQADLKNHGGPDARSWPIPPIIIPSGARS